MEHIITVDDVMALNPCRPYTRERVYELIGDGVSIRQALELPIPVEHVLWLVLREKFMPRDVLRRLAILWAERALPLYEEQFPNDARPRRAIETARAHLNGGANDAELAAASEAASDAAEAASDAARAKAEAASTAARAAVWTALAESKTASAAAWVVAWAEAEAASTTAPATWVATLAATRAQQLADIRETLSGVNQ